jgi:hypothetical protein
MFGTPEPNKMSAMDRAVLSVLSKLIPPEILAALSPEKLSLYGKQAEEFVNNTKAELAAFKQEQMRQSVLLERIAGHVGITEPTYGDVRLIHGPGANGPQEPRGSAPDHSDGGSAATGT